MNPHTTRAQLTQADRVVVQAYACTKVVIGADGRGYAGLEQGKPYAFTWQQQGARLTITYPGAPAESHLPGGVYSVRLVTGSPHLTTSPITQLELSTAQGETHILEALP
ncbi:MAG: hypothetical protein EOO38_27835 [Cytophagaceae bacterium]|nr:MAG: hypothetical protein EOO38_27835 [Cytophagaceae bacterium]